MDTVLKEQYSKLGPKAVDALNKNGFQAQYVDNKEEAVAAALKLIEAGATIGMGGSMTVKALGLKEVLEKAGHVIYDHQGKPGEEGVKLRHQELGSDVFLTSSNAVTMEGELVNVDGTGNRLAAMIYGPKRIVMLVGANKIVRDEAAGRERIRMVAAPLNTLRLKRPTPCTVTGMCMNCKGTTRICNATLVLHRPLSEADFHVIIIGEALGY